MRRTFFTALALAVMLALGATTVLAANPHLVGSLTTTAGPAANQVTVSGKIAGLGSGYAGTELDATANVTFDVVCTNSRGKAAPGQQGGSGSLAGSGSVDDVDSNGAYTFRVTFTINLTPAKAFGCPNNQWTASATNVVVTLTSLTLDDGTSIDL